MDFITNVLNTKSLALGKLPPGLAFDQWLRRASIVLRGKPYSTYRHEYLEQIIKDPSPDQTFLKAAQVAISTLVLLKSIYVAESLGKKSIYFFPDDSSVSDFSNDRCTPMLRNSPYLKTRVQDINNVGLKQIGDGSIYFRGLFSRGKALSVDADFVILDEVSEMKDEHRALAHDRIMHSDLQWVHALSQPNVPGHGIDAEFSATDQHYWHLVCDGCGHENCMELDFPNNLIPITNQKASKFPPGATHYRGCSRCQKKLIMKNGVWVAHQPARMRRGYHLSQLYTQIKAPGYPNYATKVMAEYNDARKSMAKMGRFQISILGFPYGGGAARVTDELLDRCEGGYSISQHETGAYMGVDQGDVLTIAVGIRSGNVFKAVYFTETESWDTLSALMERFGVHYCVIDALPNKHSAKMFAQKHRGRVSIQYFKQGAMVKKQEVFEEDKTVEVINVDRTESLDAMIDKLENGVIIMPSRSAVSSDMLSVLEDVRRHLKKLIVRYEYLEDGGVKRIYLGGANIENHYGMALNSASIAAFEFGTVSGPMVMPIFGRGRVGKTEKS